MRQCLLLIGLCCSLPLLAQPLPLDELLRQDAEGPALREQMGRLQALQAELALREAEQGWSLFGSLGAGSAWENEINTVATPSGGVVNDKDVDDYGLQTYQLGVTYPLLGSLKRQADAVQAAQGAVEQQRLQLLVARAEQRLTLRTAYVDWWAMQELVRWCQDLQPTAAEALQRLAEREQGGWLRRSEALARRADWQALQRQCHAAPARQDEARELLGLLVSVPAQAEALPVPLAEQPQELPAWQALLRQNPQLALREQALEQARAEQGSDWYDEVESSFSLSQTQQQSPDYIQENGQLLASLSFSMPFDLLDAGAARAELGEANLLSAEQAAESQRQQLQFALARALRDYRQALREVADQQARVQQYRQLREELRARSQVEGEGDLLATLQAEHDALAAGLGLLQAWRRAWQLEAQLHLFADDSPSAARLLGERHLSWPGLALQPLRSSWNQGVYIWDSRALLDGQRRAGELAALRASGLQQLYVGLSAAQLKTFAQTHAGLAALLREAPAQGLQVSLLLGDPQWITPAQRDELLKLIRRLDDLPFAGLLLDLEVEQLGWPVPAQRLQDWLDTLQAAAAASPWPLSIASHPRWFAETTQPCVPCALPALQSISLMIYSSQPQTSTERALRIARRWPQLHFRLAQSVEADQPASIAWRDVPASRLQQQVEQWRAALQPVGLGGIDWQAWQDYPRTAARP